MIRLSLFALPKIRKETSRWLSTSSQHERLADLTEWMHGRKRAERRDSVTEQMLIDRQQHQDRLKRIDVEKREIDALEHLGLGLKRRRHGVYRTIVGSYYQENMNRKTATGSGGYAVHLSSAAKDWPIFKHALPEIAFAGHSNSGKSTLVNAMVGVLPKKGPAGVSERAGWTDQICFYQLGKKPPVLILSDLPGYGHAVASPDEKREWQLMTRDYLANRTTLSRCCVLVDSTRGLCTEDLSMVKYLEKNQVPWQIILTKCDLLSPEEVAQSIAAVREDLDSLLHGLYNKYTTTAAGAAGAAVGTAVSILSGERDTNKTEGRQSDHDGVDEEEEAEYDEEYDEEDCDMSSSFDFDRKEEGEEVSVLVPVLRGESSLVKKQQSPYLHMLPVRPGKPVIKWDQRIIPVSASTGAGVPQLWSLLKSCASASSQLVAQPTAVREHVLADVLRRENAMEIGNFQTIAGSNNKHVVAAKANANTRSAPAALNSSLRKGPGPPSSFSTGTPSAARAPIIETVTTSSTGENESRHQSKAVAVRSATVPKPNNIKEVLVQKLGNNRRLSKRKPKI